jgi:pimeloyl-ACP methyl ester carboxylesterase
MTDTTRRHVLLLHGIWMVGATLRWFGARLRAAGHAPEIFGYHSIVGGPQAAVPRLVHRLRDGPPADIVAHSLGGLVALQALSEVPELPAARVVCLGVPLSGSAAAQRLARRSVTALYLGRSATLLQQGCATWPEQHSVGMIAGSLPRGLGAFFARFDGAHDGTVAVAETRSPQLADHVVVAASHSGLLFSAEAARQADVFLRAGRFDHRAGGQSARASAAGGHAGPIE